MGSRLVLQELCEPSGIADRAAERRAVHVVIVEMQPGALISANELVRDQQPFDEAQPRGLSRKRAGRRLVVRVVTNRRPQTAASWGS
jgi:hypothetical protein